MEDPRTKSGKIRRWHRRMTLLQHALRVQESVNRALDSLGHIVRHLIEDEAEGDPVLTPVPLMLASDSEDEMQVTESEEEASVRISEGKTTYFEAMTDDVFAKLARRRYADAIEENQRDAVRALVRKGRDSGIIAAPLADQLEREFKSR